MLLFAQFSAGSDGLCYRCQLLLHDLETSADRYRIGMLLSEQTETTDHVVSSSSAQASQVNGTFSGRTVKISLKVKVPTVVAVISEIMFNGARI